MNLLPVSLSEIKFSGIYLIPLPEPLNFVKQQAENVTSAAFSTRIGPVF